MNKILVLGDGLLGSEVVKQSNWDYISRKKDNIDFEYPFTYIEFLKDYDQILNCIGYTDTYSQERDKHWNINFSGVIDLANYCFRNDKKLIHISSDYLYSGSKVKASEDDVPVHCANWYGYTKLLGDGYVQAKLKKYLLIRTSFKPNPFPFDNAIDQVGNFDYIDIIAGLIISLIRVDAIGIFNVGTHIKSMKELALETRENVGYSEDIDLTMPHDVSMDINKLNNFLGM